MKVLNLICRLPIRINKSQVPSSNVESMETMRRRRPLHTFGASFLAIAHNICMKLQESGGPLGSTVKRAINISKLVLPFVCSMLYQWLAVLSLIDDQILSVEKILEFIFPPSKGLFDKIDGLVCSAEALPEKFDDVWRKVPFIFHHHFPFLDWVVFHLISWLNFALSFLSHWGTKSTKEKEISVDENCKKAESSKDTISLPLKSVSDSSKEKLNEERSHCLEPSNHKKVDKSCSLPEKKNVSVKSVIEPVNAEVIHKAMKKLHLLESKKGKVIDETAHSAMESPMSAAYKSAVSSPSFDFSQEETSPFGHRGKPETMKCTYKEMLENGTKEDSTTKEDIAHLNKEKAKIDGIEGEKGGVAKDQILELFDESWHLK